MYWKCLLRKIVLIARSPKMLAEIIWKLITTDTPACKMLCCAVHVHKSRAPHGVAFCDRDSTLLPFKFAFIGFAQPCLHRKSYLWRAFIFSFSSSPLAPPFTCSFCGASQFGGPALNLGKNFPTRAWYSLYSGYFPPLISSVNRVLP